MSKRQLLYTAKVLLLLYIGYFGCVSYFVHKHVYNGVVYIHSHPYDKTKEENKDDKVPFETHSHNAAGFFTLNEVSNYTSFQADEPVVIETSILILEELKQKPIQINFTTCKKTHFRHRAPPFA